MYSNLNGFNEVKYLSADEVQSQCVFFTIGKEFSAKIKPMLLAQTNRAYCGMFINETDVPDIDSIDLVKNMGMDGLVLNARYVKPGGNINPIWYALNIVNPKGVYVPMLIGLIDSPMMHTGGGVVNDSDPVLCFVFTKDTASEMVKVKLDIMDKIKTILSNRGMYHDDTWVYRDKNFDTQYNMLFDVTDSDLCTDLSNINKDQNTRILQQLPIALRLGSMYYENSHGVVSVSVAVKHVFKDRHIVATKFITAYAPFNEQVIRVQWPEEMTDLMQFVDMHKVSSGAIKPLEKLFNGSLVKALNN